MNEEIEIVDKVVENDLLRELEYETAKDIETQEIEYWEKNQERIKRTIQYKNGVKHGMVCSYYKNGTVYSQINYKNGKLHGESKYFYPDGKIDEEVIYKNNYLDGISKAYYKNGKLSITQSYKDGFLHGNTVYYDNNTGLAYKKETYKDGIKIQTEELYKL